MHGVYSHENERKRMGKEVGEVCNENVSGREKREREERERMEGMINWLRFLFFSFVFYSIKKS